MTLFLLLGQKDWSPDAFFCLYFHGFPNKVITLCWGCMSYEAQISL